MILGARQRKVRLFSNGGWLLLHSYFADHGSLYDLLHNETMIIEGELLLPILRDISQGVRFLHSAEPKVIHGDLKAQNILVDDRFRAKVADFGLSQKKSVGATGVSVLPNSTAASLTIASATLYTNNLHHDALSY